MLTMCKIHAGISQNEMPAEVGFHSLKHLQSFFSHDTQGVPGGPVISGTPQPSGVTLHINNVL
jgi:hypothetical protein